MSTPHDAVFKRFTLSDTARGIFSFIFPISFAKNTLRSDDVETGADSFIEKNLRAFYSDVPVAKTCEGDGYIYVKESIRACRTRIWRSG